MKTPTTLKKALLGNAAFSLASALAMALSSPWLSAQLGLSATWPVYGVSIGLALYAPYLLWLALKEPRPPAGVWMAIGGDLSWVLASVVLGTLYADKFTGVGLFLVIAAAVLVMTFADFQLLGLWKTRKHGAAI